MNSDFDYYLKNAIDKCAGKETDDDKFREGFDVIYSFATENISGYIDLFDLNDKSLLTVGSSGDQSINAALCGCKDQTIIDLNPYTKYFYHLKKAAILSLNYNEFLSYMCYKNYPESSIDNNDIFNIETFKKIKNLLEELDYESYLFWNELFNLFTPLAVRKNLFSNKLEKYKVVKKCNLYMRDENYYNTAKKTIINVQPDFIVKNIFDFESNRKYDNIFLSNIHSYHDYKIYKEKIVDNLVNYLTDDGSLLLTYLYDTKINDIINSRKIMEAFKEYITMIVSFTGVGGLLFDNGKIVDSVSIYRKIKKI